MRHSSKAWTFGVVESTALFVESTNLPECRRKWSPTGSLMSIRQRMLIQEGCVSMQQCGQKWTHAGDSMGPAKWYSLDGRNSATGREKWLLATSPTVVFGKSFQLLVSVLILTVMM
jgi:hypothetical protein